MHHLCRIDVDRSGNINLYVLGRVDLDPEYAHHFDVENAVIIECPDLLQIADKIMDEREAHSELIAEHPAIEPLRLVHSVTHIAGASFANLDPPSLACWCPDPQRGHQNDCPMSGEL